MAVDEKVLDQKKEVTKMIDTLVANAQKALKAFRDYDQEAIDHIVKQMALAGLDKHMYLAKLAIEETKRGVYEDKIIKNILRQNTFTITLNTIKRLASSEKMNKKASLKLPSLLG